LIAGPFRASLFSDFVSKPCRQPIPPSHTLRGCEFFETSKFFERLKGAGTLRVPYAPKIRGCEQVRADDTQSVPATLENSQPLRGNYGNLFPTSLRLVVSNPSPTAPGFDSIPTTAPRP